MIGVSGRVVCLPISVTESRVVSIRAFLTHIFLHALPFLDGKSVLVVALIVPLRGGREGMTFWMDSVSCNWTTSTYYLPVLPAGRVIADTAAATHGIDLYFH